jgi:hypothetical protein
MSRHAEVVVRDARANDCDVAELVLVEAKGVKTEKQRQRQAALRRSTRMLSNTIAMLSYQLGLSVRGRNGLLLPSPEPAPDDRPERGRQLEKLFDEPAIGEYPRTS